MTTKSNIRGATVALCETAVCAALLCVLSPLTVPTPLGVGFTLQVFVVVLNALLLKPLCALSAQVVYTLLGIAGLPVFAGFQSGFGVLAGPTGGFLIGFLLASFFVSLAKGSGGKYATVRFFLCAVLIGIPCIYLPGITGFMLYTGGSFHAAFLAVASSFIPVDLVKCALAALIAVPVSRALQHV